MNYVWRCGLVSVAFLSLAVIATRGSAGPHQFCEGDVPLLKTVRMTNASIVEPLSLLSGRDGESSGLLSLRNIGLRPIGAVAIQVDFQDGFGNVRFRLPYLAVAKVAETAFNPPFYGEFVESWNAPLPPGETASIFGLSYSVTQQCPKTAEVTYVGLYFLDGSKEELFTRGWQSDPVLDFFPTARMRLPLDHASAPLDLVVRVRIDTCGRISQIIYSKNDHSSLVRILASQMRTWSFLPRLVDGKPVEDELSLLLLFRSKLDEASALEVQGLPDRFSILKLIVGEEAFDWKVWYGRRIGATELHRDHGPNGKGPAFSNSRSRQEHEASGEER